MKTAWNDVLSNFVPGCGDCSVNSFGNLYNVYFPVCVSIQVFFSVLIGAFSLGQAAPNLENLLTAAGAAGAIFETIDRVRTLTAESVFVCLSVCVCAGVDV